MSIVINKKTDHFFISINKIKKHSFIMLGVYEQNQVKHLLCRVGKFAVMSQFCGDVKLLFKALFLAAEANLRDEGSSRKRKNAWPITYQAYDITYDQYLEFMQMLESLHIDTGYKPIIIKGDEVTLELSKEHILPPAEHVLLKKNVGELRVGNTCRHTAIKMIETTLHTPCPSSLVSSHFFKELPYKTQLEYGKPTKDIPFYVLPPSPLAFPELNQVEKKILTKLYRRMEYMLLLKTHSQSTQDKFLKVKDLYLHLLGCQKKLSLRELLESIQHWKEQNKPILEVLRKRYVWDSFFNRKAETMKLVAELECDLKNTLSYCGLH